MLSLHSCKSSICSIVNRYGNYGDMFIKLLKDSEDETWDLFFVFEQDSPSDDILAKYEARLQYYLQLPVFLWGVHVLVSAHTHCFGDTANRALPWTF